MTKTVRIAEAAKAICVSPNTLRRWESEGRIKPFGRNPSGQRVYDLESLMKMVPNARARTAAPEPGSAERDAIKAGEAARRLGLDLRKLNALISEGRIRPVFVTAGGHRYFEPDTVERLSDKLGNERIEAGEVEISAVLTRDPNSIGSLIAQSLLRSKGCLVKIYTGAEVADFTTQLAKGRVKKIIYTHEEDLGPFGGQTALSERVGRAGAGVRCLVPALVKDVDAEAALRDLIASMRAFSGPRRSVPGSSLHKASDPPKPTRG